MTNVSSRPMQTPDLAGLLGRPRKRTATASDSAPTSPPQVEEAAPADDAAITAPEAPPPTEVRNVVPVIDTSITGPVIPDEAVVRARARNRAGSEATQPARRQYLRSTTVYLPRSLHAAIARQAADRGSTATALILTAVNSVHRGVAEALSFESTPSADDLFDIPQNKGVAEPSVQTTMRVTDQQFAVLESLASTLGVTRSKLIVTATKLYLARDQLQP